MRLILIVSLVSLKVPFNISSDVALCLFSVEFVSFLAMFSLFEFSITELTQPEGYEYRKGEQSSPKSVIV